MTVDWPDDNDSQHKASAIAATGVPLLTNSLVLSNTLGSPVTQAPGVGSTSSNFTVEGIGYELICVFQTSNDAVASYGHIRLDWIDSVSGQQVDQDNFWAYGGVAATNHIFKAKGPTKGDTVNVFLQTPIGSPGSMIMSYVLLQNGRVYQKDKVQSTQISVGGILVTGRSDTIGRILGQHSDTVIPGNPIQFALPMWLGDAIFYAKTASGAADADFQFVTAVDTNINATQPLAEFQSASNGMVAPSRMTMPGAQMTLIIANNNAANQVINWGLIAVEE